ncbi:Ni-sirohydrochlorin a,c-diamide reductive cyclase catalytic subunit [Methanopyrus sp. SNP6]|uniref:Ni-sirohydrochlorin a,c-diamide reductive cyclase catalytic subunit n=1 Tax=Methanopyrus sp. SNP6 TaxID=1937005 RepID=UPI001AEFD9C7|nr:Ni-sirohydrochlorin a,c-diamide reductive cyclase catalytic subunit [Methanopyrus sp. SNP6]
MSTWHPRPGPIPAAMYTLRDLLADAVVLHGPKGCCFRTARLLEKDGVRVFVTGMEEDDFVFGALEKLVELLEYVEKRLEPELIGVVGTCVSSIIGEDLEAAVDEANTDATVVTVEVHNGMGPNTEGVIRTLERAAEAGVIPKGEVERQKRLMRAAAELERKRGMASRKYLKPWSGHDPSEVARVLLSYEDVLAILNAKKETAYIFADPILELGKRGAWVLANLSPESGLPKVRRDAEVIGSIFREEGIEFEVTGSLDEYAVTGELLAKKIEEFDPDSVLITGIPHAVAPEELDVDATFVAVTDGLREASALRELGYDYVVVEEEAHARVLGRREIVPSDLGEAIRQLSA